MASVGLPPRLVARVRKARRVVEVGAGRAFDTALALHAAAPDVELFVTDVDSEVLRAPAPLRAVVHDITRDGATPFAGADLVYAVRLPEELQAACARFARNLGADLALRPLKDEWADVAPSFLVHEAWPDGWRFFPSTPRREA